MDRAAVERRRETVVEPLVEARRTTDRSLAEERNDREATPRPKQAPTFGERERNLGRVEQLEGECHEQRVEGDVGQRD